MTEIKRGWTRRQFLEVLMMAPILAMGGSDLLPSSRKEDSSEWPTNPEAILARIKELRFTPGSELRTTIFPRKTVWEMAQVLKKSGSWPGGDESDWYNHLDTFKETLSVLKEAGLKGGRLVIVPFELTRDGKTYDWSPMEAGIEAMRKQNMSVDLAVGPLDYPYYPGIRLPINLENMLRDEITQTGQKNIHISLDEDPNLPKSSVAIRDFALGFLEKMITKYGEDERIDKFYLGNEWPDTHGVEGIEGATMSIGQDLMQEMVKIIKSRTTKPIALNTNIPVAELEKLQKEIGPLLDALGEQGVLGFDTYPTQEPSIDSTEYQQLIENFRAAFPKTTVNYTEFQGEPWPPDNLAGQSWADIFTNHPEIIRDFYQKLFPSTLETKVIPSEIREIVLWIAPILPVLKALGYEFPIEMFKTIAEAMEKAK